MFEPAFRIVGNSSLIGLFLRCLSFANVVASDALRTDHTGFMFVAASAYVLGVATLLLWLSGDWRWVEGWIFDVWWVSFISAGFLWLHYKDLGLLAERMRMPQNRNKQQPEQHRLSPHNLRRVTPELSAVHIACAIMALIHHGPPDAPLLF